MASIYKQTYTATTADGRKVKRKCKVYTIQYVDNNGRRHRTKGYTDKAATEQLAAKLGRAVALGAEGLVDQFREQKAKPLTEHVAAYISDLRAIGRDDKYIDVMKQRLAILVKECGWTTLVDINSDSFMRWREARRDISHRGTRADLKGTSAATLNQFLDSARAFTNWCVLTSRIEGVSVGNRKVSTLLAGVGKVSGEKVRKRRALDDDQVAKLLAVAPADRALVYRVGLSIGLRRQEIEDLRWGDLRLGALPPYVQLREEATKSRRADRVHFAASLADKLRKHRPDDADDAARVFVRVPSLVLWQNDLKAAGIPWADANGRRADFHGGTRKTLCSRMHRSGVPLAIAMRTMRHTDVKLTMVDYVDDHVLGHGNVLPEIVAAPPVVLPVAQTA
jgi:integrase